MIWKPAFLAGLAAFDFIQYLFNIRAIYLILKLQDNLNGVLEKINNSLINSFNGESWLFLFRELNSPKYFGRRFSDRAKEISLCSVFEMELSCVMVILLSEISL